MAKKRWFIGAGMLMIAIWSALANRYLTPTIVPLTPNTQLLFFSTGTMTKTLTQTNHCTTAINGSYFGRSWATFFPAGERFTTTGTITYKKKENPDPNLWESLVFEQSKGEVKLFIADGEEIATGSQVFNAGPRLLKSWLQNPALTAQISHRNTPHPRTILAQNGSQTYLILFKNKTTLSKTAQRLLAHSFQNAANLDGGPSTSISSAKPWILDFNNQEKLPIIFCLP